MLMRKINIPIFEIGEEYCLHEFDLIPIKEYLANNKLAYYIYRYRKIRKYKIYFFYNCDILSAVMIYVALNDVKRFEFLYNNIIDSFQHKIKLEDGVLYVKEKTSELINKDFFSEVWVKQRVNISRKQIEKQ